MKIKSLILLFLIAGLMGCGDKFPKHLSQAEKFLSEKNYVDCVDSINNGLMKWHESDGTEVKAQAYEILGKSYHQLRNTDKAIEAYRQAVALSKNSFDSAMALGNIYLIKSQPDMAAKFFLDALKMKPNHPLAYLGLGNSYYLGRKIPEAKAAFERVLDTSPGVREAQEQLAALKSLARKKTTRTVIYKRSPQKTQPQRKRR